MSELFIMTFLLYFGLTIAIASAFFLYILVITACDDGKWYIIFVLSMAIGFGLYSASSRCLKDIDNPAVLEAK